ncbi:hypothetical protein RB195_003559 [Necator americanus]|uniref:Uncharacterized protein n=1 Tax=Necator americanus TaxID=51031 RepID=A0ABR1DP40_NECAM
MAFSYLLGLFVLFFFITPACSFAFGMGGGGGCCCGGRKKRSIEEQEEQRFHANDGDRLCNSPELKRLLRKHMADNPESSKMNLEMYFSFLFHFFVVMFLIAPIFSCGFGLGGGGGGCCCGGGGGRKKRSVDDQLEQRFHADDGDKLCSSPEMKQILRKHMTKDPVTSKTNLVNALYQEGDHFFVLARIPMMKRDETVKVANKGKKKGAHNSEAVRRECTDDKNDK